MLCDYVLCIRPKIKYLFCSILKLRETMCFRKENNGCYRSTITQNENFTLYIMWFTIPEIKTPVPTNAGNEIQSCVGMLNFISWGVTYVYKNISQKGFFFSVRLLSVLCGHSFFSSPPQRPMTSDFEVFLHQILYITFIKLQNCLVICFIFVFGYFFH